MKILDELGAYNGKLNYRELVELVTRINNRVNAQVNQGIGRIPLMCFNKEKAFLLQRMPVLFPTRVHSIISHFITNSFSLFHTK